MSSLTPTRDTSSGNEGKKVPSSLPPTLPLLPFGKKEQVQQSAPKISLPKEVGTSFAWSHDTEQELDRVKETVNEYQKNAASLLKHSPTVKQSLSKMDDDIGAYLDKVGKRVARIKSNEQLSDGEKAEQLEKASKNMLSDAVGAMGSSTNLRRVAYESQLNKARIQEYGTIKISGSLFSEDQKAELGNKFRPIVNAFIQSYTADNQQAPRQEAFSSFKKIYMAEGYKVISRHARKNSGNMPAPENEQAAQPIASPIKSRTGRQGIAQKLEGRFAWAANGRFLPSTLTKNGRAPASDRGKPSAGR